MKTNAKNLGIALIASVTVLFGCKKEDLRPMARPTPVSSVSTKPVAKELNFWKITSFKLDGKYTSDETVKFEGWAFQFNDDGTVVARRKEEKLKGHWGTKMNGSREIMVFDFGGQEPFYELNNYWEVAKKSSSYMFLQDQDDSDGSTGELFFEKI